MNAQIPNNSYTGTPQPAESYPLTVKETLEQRYRALVSVREAITDLARRGVITRPWHLRIGVGAGAGK